MKISYNESEEIFDVYGIYQISEDIYYLVISSDHSGMVAINCKNTKIIDPVIPKGFIFQINSQGFTLFPEILQDSSFLERLLECDELAVRVFLNNVT